MAQDAVTIAGATLRLVQGDITDQHVDAIVNAANSTLLGGGGVDGAIHRRGGPAILEECQEIRRTRYPDGLPTGDAVATTAGRLPARRVIHTVGPRWHGGGAGEAELLASAYRSTLARAREEGLRTLAFPSISTGAYGYPIEAAARVALGAVADELRVHAGAFDEVRFVLFSAADLAVYREALRQLS
ncbi:MAG: O-acetyl-ADP-ribose deacetylase [Gemmatimonadetes bacterium]|nr:O-acetyl-ADP-ribose deacetylase [Gemmatimonadota bacterium]